MVLCVNTKSEFVNIFIFLLTIFGSMGVKMSTIRLVDNGCKKILVPNYKFIFKDNVEYFNIFCRKAENELFVSQKNRELDMFISLF